MVKKKVEIYTVQTQPKDYEYWLTKTPVERLEAVEYLRQQYGNASNENESRFQRVFRVIKRTKR